MESKQYRLHQVQEKEYLHCNSLGKAMLAHMSEETVLEIIERHGLPKKTKNTITNLEDLLAELEDVREQGHAFDEEELITGLRCVAAPVRDSSENIFGAVSVLALLAGW